jgi:precorrin-6A synthase (deacetylating)
MKTILVIGIGMGSPGHLTMDGIAALNRADVLFVPEKGHDKTDLADVRREIIARFVTSREPHILSYAVPRRDVDNPDYRRGVDDWHSALVGVFDLLISDVPDEGVGAFLVWGDPGLYDSTLRILAQLPEPANIEVIPGISAVQALTAAHGIALNRVGQPVLITTGRRLGVVETDTVVMLDGRMAFLEADPDLEIFWGAYLGTPNQLLISGRLGEVADHIVATRTSAREQHGWIMDTYLLRLPQ